MATILISASKGLPFQITVPPFFTLKFLFTMLLNWYSPLSTTKAPNISNLPFVSIFNLISPSPLPLKVLPDILSTTICATASLVTSNLKLMVNPFNFSNTTSSCLVSSTSST